MDTRGYDPPIMNSIRHKYLVIVLVLLGVLRIPPASIAGEDPRDYPYRIVPRTTFPGVGRIFDEGWRRSSVVFHPEDSDSDVVLRCLSTGARRLDWIHGAWQERWMEPFPTQFNNKDNFPTVDGVWMFDDPREPVAVFHCSTPDRKRFLFECRRVSDGTLRSGFEIAGGPDHDGNGVWDGNIRIMGVIRVPGDQGSRQALVLLSRAGYDLGPRGIRAQDVETGDTLWTYFVGPKPKPRNSHLADLDRDGSPEIIFGGAAVDNIHKGYFHGTRDDTSRVFVLDTAGQLRWSRAFSPYPAIIFIKVADLRGDSLPEILVGTRSTDWAGNGLFLLDGEGNLLDSLMMPAGVRRMAVFPGEGSSRSVLIQTGEFTLMKIGTVPKLEIKARVKLDVSMALGGIADLTPEPGPEILLSGGKTWPTWIYSADLKPLAYLPAGRMPVGPSVLGFFHTGPDTAITFVRGWKNSSVIVDPWAFSVERNPRRVPWGWLGLVVVGGVALPVARRLHRKSHPSAATRRELQLQLLDRLKLSGHGAIGGLSAVRRLVWNLNALVQGFALGEERRQVMRELLADIRANQLPKLEAAVELARLAGLDPGDTDRAAGSLAALGKQLGEAEGTLQSGTVAVTVAQELKDSAEEAEHAFQKLRKVVESSFSVDPEAVVVQSLTAHQERLAATGIKVETCLEGIPTCCVDGEELAFVLDNLIDNAVRAMQGGRDPRLTITWQEAGGWLTLFVADTGCGIVPDDWQRIFEAGQSRRTGGGLGLPHSREILRKFGGGLMVQESSPGGGTIMALTLMKGGS